MTESHTPLYAACEQLNIDVVAFLLKHGANPNEMCCTSEQPGDWKETALHVVCTKSGDNKLHALIIVRLLVDYGADVNAVCEKGETALYRACAKEQVQVIQLLLSFGADVNWTTSQSYPLIVACSVYLEIGREFAAQFSTASLSDCVAVKRLNVPPHDIAKSHSNSEVIIKLLLENAASVKSTTSQGHTALCTAICNGHSWQTNVVHLLLEAGADLCSTCEHSIEDLLQFEDCPHILDFFLQNRISVSSSLATNMLGVAVQKGLVHVSQILLKHGANVNKAVVFGKPVLFYAAGRCLFEHGSCCQCQLVKLLMNAGADVNVVDDSGNTVLHHIIDNNRSSECAFLQHTVDRLLYVGADVNICNGQGQSPLFLAVIKGLVVFVEDMLLCGGNPNMHGSVKSPLSAACASQNLTLVVMLLKAGADPNLTTVATEQTLDITSELPLIIAIKKVNLELAEILFTYGANVNQLNPLRKSALHFVIENLDVNRYNSITKQTVLTERSFRLLTHFLMDHGADVNQLNSDWHSPLSVLLSGEPVVARSDDVCWMQLKSDINETIKAIITRRANLADSHPNIGCFTSQRRERNLRNLCSYRDQISIYLLKAGAGFMMLAFYCGTKSAVFHDLAKAVHCCKAVIMAGYVPSTQEVEHLQQSVSGEHVVCEHAELLIWLNEDRETVPSLMRQCRIVIRHLLSVASNHCTILPAIDQLPLANDLQKYLKFEGCLSEIDLSDCDFDF